MYCDNRNFTDVSTVICLYLFWNWSSCLDLFKERGDRLKIVWALFAVFPIFIPYLLPLPLIVYLLISRSYASSCPTCNEKIRPDYVTCPRCGQHLKEKCLNCGRSIEKSWNYCPSCSKEL